MIADFLKTKDADFLMALAGAMTGDPKFNDYAGDGRETLTVRLGDGEPEEATLVAKKREGCTSYETWRTSGGEFGCYSDRRLQWTRNGDCIGSVGEGDSQSYVYPVIAP